MNQWDEQKVYFVIRCKENVISIEESIVCQENENIQSDITGEFELQPSFKKNTKKLPMVLIYDKTIKQYIELMTNNFN